MKTAPSGLEPPDSALMVLSARGDRAAFGVIASRHAARVWRLAYRLTGHPDVADDIAQETLLRAWRSASQFDTGRGTLAAWLNRIAVNLATDWHRSTRSQTTQIRDDTPDHAPNQAAMMEASEATDRLAAGLAALPDRQREAITLAYLEERTGAEAAAALGISARALEGLLHRARRFLREWHAREA